MSSIDTDEIHNQFSTAICYSRSTDWLTSSGWILPSVTALINCFIFFVLIWKLNWTLDASWKIDPHDILINSLNSNNSDKVLLPGDSGLERHLGFFAGTQVEVKALNRKIKLSKDMKNQITALKSIHHENILPFVGVSLKYSKLWLIFQRSHNSMTLSNILEDETISLNWHVMNSWIQALVCAMNHLHTVIGIIHGNLNPTTCLIDSRWQLRITDFGLGRLTPRSKEALNVTSTFWIAPEILKNPSLWCYGTKPSDVYSFGQLVFMLVNCYQAKRSIQVTDHKVTSDLSDLSLSAIEGEPYWLKYCCHENPNCRPDFQIILGLHSLGKKEMNAALGNDGGLRISTCLSDSMKRVKARLTEILTLDDDLRWLQEDVIKKEEILNKMLLKYAAESLMLNLRVEPKNIPSATLLFGHIHNFDALTEKLTPDEQYNLVQEVSASLDSVSEKFRVRKLEMVGSAYFVASWPGLMDRSWFNPTREVALMALDLNSMLQKYNEIDLKLTFGLHVGQVAGGVIGQSLPHFHLFGDAVNMTSRLSTTGEPGKIQLSEECREILSRSNEFQIIERGVIYIKGKGETRTYWLTGRSYIPEVQVMVEQ